MEMTVFATLARRFFSNQQHGSDKKEARKMQKWSHKLMRRAAALSLGLAVFGLGTMAHAFNGVLVTPENIAGMDIHPEETNFIVNTNLCGGSRTYLHVPADHPFHDRVFAIWNMTALNGNNLNVWGQCWSSNPGGVHADLEFLAVSQ